MPRIPTKQASVEPRPIRPALASQAAIATASRSIRFATAITASSFEQAGEAAFKIREKGFATQKTRLHNQLREQVYELEFGEAGFRNARGEHALIAEAEVNTDIDGMRNELAGKIGNERVRDEWVQETSGFTLDFKRRVAQHTSTEQDNLARIEFQQDVEGSNKESLANLLNFKDHPESALPDFALSAKRHEDILRARGAQMGWPDKMIDSIIADRNSGLYMSAVQSLISQGEGEAADELYQLTRDAIQSDDRIKIAGKLAPAKKEQEANARVAEMFNGIDKGYKSEDVDAVNDQILSEKNADMQDAMVRQADRRWGMLKEERRLTNNEQIKRVFAGLYDDPDIAKYQEVDPYWDEFPLTMQEAIVERSAQLRKGETPLRKMEGFIRWEYRPTYDKKGEINGYRDATPLEKSQFELLEIQHLLDPTTWNALRKEQNAIDAAGQADPEASSKVVTRLNEVMDAWRGHELDQSEKGFLRHLVRAGAEEYERENGKPPGGQAADEIIGGVMEPVYRKGKEGRSTNMFPAGLMKHLDAEDQAKLMVGEAGAAQIGKVERDAIINYLRTPAGGFRLGSDIPEAEVRRAAAQLAGGTNPALAAMVEESQVAEERRAASEIEDLFDGVLDFSEEPPNALLPVINQTAREAGGYGPSYVPGTEERQEVWRSIQEQHQDLFSDWLRSQIARDKPFGGHDVDLMTDVEADLLRMYHTLIESGKTTAEARQLLGVPPALSLFGSTLEESSGEPQRRETRERLRGLNF